MFALMKRFGMWRSSFCGLCVVAAVFTAPAASAEWQEGQKLADLKDAGLEGALPELSGKVVLVDFWASWCGPCRKSFVSFAEFHREYKDRGFVIVAVSVDDTVAAMEGFLEDRDVPFTIVRDAEEKLVASAGIQAMPTSYMVDRQGVIRFVHGGYYGEKTDKQLREEIETLLNEED